MLKFDDIILSQGTFRMTACFEVPTGKITAILGPSGGGKSTLIAAVAGFLAPVRGRIMWADTDITARKPSDRPVSILFQDNNLFPHMTIAENVGLALRPDLRLNAAQRGAVEDALKSVGLGGYGTRKPAALSGGQQSRAALSRVLLADRDVVLLDEPFSALGPGLKSEMLELVRTKLSAAGKTVLMVTHDPNDAKDIADYVVLVADGAALAPVSTTKMFANPPDALKTYLGLA